MPHEDRDARSHGPPRLTRAELRELTLLVDRAGQVTACCGRLTLAYGWQEHEVVGHGAAETLFAGSLAQHYREALAAAAEAGEWHGELAIAHASGARVGAAVRIRVRRREPRFTVSVLPGGASAAGET